MSKNFLQDKRFLRQMDNLAIKDQYIKLTILSWKQDTIAEVQGRVTGGGPFNLDGNSSLRRTGSLTVLADEESNDLAQVDNLFSINRKVKVEVGLKNKVPPYIYQSEDDSSNQLINYTVDYQKLYGDIIWYPCGVFVIFDPSVSYSTQGATISLSLKDKMCLLNGDAGGVLPAAVHFHEREQILKNGETVITKPTLRQIVQQCVNHYGKESLENIVIQDLEERIKTVMRYTGDRPVYCDGNRYSYNKEELDSDSATIRTFSYGDDIGFIYSDFVYPGELIVDAGGTVTEVLDKIVQVLGNYEYFYDVNGKFHFQQIKNYLNTTYTSSVLKDKAEEQNYEIELASNKSVYSFNNSNLITSYNNSPKYSNIKNDFIVWGVRKTATDIQVPIRYHLSIDARPTQKVIDNQVCYGKHQNVVFYTDQNKNIRARIGDSGQTIYTKDWREELYYQGLESEGTATNSNDYFVELINEWAKLYDLRQQVFKESVKRNLSGIDFYLDFIDTSADIGKYSVENIGRRSKVISDDKINCVFENQIPDIIIICKDVTEANLDDVEKALPAETIMEIKAKANGDLPTQIQLAKTYFLDTMSRECDLMGQNYTQVEDSFYDLLTIGGYQNSCFERIKDLLYQYTNMNNTISLSCMPIYYLQPNMRITVQDSVSGIYGDYMINSISLPIDINNTMSITASKCLQKI